jgi:hypothetical protein
MNHTPLLDQIRVYSEALVDDLPDVTIQPEPTVVAVPATRRRSRNVWVGVAVAVVTVLIIGISSILLNGEETQPAVTAPVTTVDDAPVTTIVGEAAPEPVEPLPLVAETPWSIEDIPPDAESGAFDTPLGLVSWVSLPIDVDTRPIGRCFVGDEGGGFCQGAEVVMPWPSGFAIFQGSVVGNPPPAMPEVPARLWVSTDGLSWREESLPSDPWARGLDLTLDNGVYWLMSEEPAGLWHTTDGSTWHEIDPTGLAPPGSSVGPTWSKRYEPPVTAGDLTLSYGRFGGDDYPDDHEQSLYIIDDNGVTQTEEPWPDVVRAMLFSTGDWIYAYTDNGQSDDATMTVWRTTDGLSWAEIGPPGFVETSGLAAKSFHLYPTLDGRLVAWSYELPGSAWETTDGLTWETVELPPLPSVDGPNGANPVLLDTGWLAVTGSKGGYFDGDNWWMKAGDIWFPLTELHLSGWPVVASGVGQTTFFSSEKTIWVMSLKTTD